MKRLSLFISLIIFVFSTCCFASQISKITLTELQQRANLIVLGEVINVKYNGNIDKVTIKVASFLKGSSAEKEISFILSTRGGLKNFDPSLKVGDTGVFFLYKDNAEVKKAYWGSVAIFPSHIFKLSEGISVK